MEGEANESIEWLKIEIQNVAVTNEGARERERQREGEGQRGGNPKNNNVNFV